MKTKLGPGALFANKFSQKLQQNEKRRQSTAGQLNLEIVKKFSAKKEVDFAEKKKR